MKNIKKIIILPLILIITIVLFTFSSFASSKPSIELYQQETEDLNSIRYICKISNVEEDDLESFKVKIKVFSGNNYQSTTNSKDYYKFYKSVSNVNEFKNIQDNVYYAVFTLSDINSAKYNSRTLVTNFNVYVSGTKYISNTKIYEIGSKYNIEASAYGYKEGAYIEFNPIDNDTDTTNYVVQYRDENSETYNSIDNELIRYDKSRGKIRADAIGLVKGKYYLRAYKLIDNVKNISNELKVIVEEDDRSGYAHFENTEGVGAYNDNGSLKDNAIVVYVNDSNKNTVQAEINGSLKTGLVNIIKAADANSDPLDIRILDTIKTCQFNSITYTSEAKSSALVIEQSLSFSGNKQGYTAAEILTKKWNSYSNDIAAGITELVGLTSKCTYSSEKFDSNWNMLDIKDKKNITIEGIGENAGIYQFGLNIVRSDYIEVKNLTFTDYPEDAIGIDGEGTHGYYWIHNCVFNKGKNNWDLSYDQDKKDGDGSTDFKKGHNLTISYSAYNNTHKSNLIGNDNSAKQYNVTLHHNYYNSCTSRLPLVRQANIHIYNNYYHNTGSHGISVRGLANAFIENSYFDGKNPFMLAYKTKDGINPVGTTIKAIGNEFADSVKVQDSDDNGIGLMANGIYVLTTADSKTYTKNLSATRMTESENSICNPNGTSYVNFDTNSDLFYYDKTNHRSNVSILLPASDVPSYVIRYSGTLNSNKYNLYNDESVEVGIDNIEASTSVINYKVNERLDLTDFYINISYLDNSIENKTLNDISAVIHNVDLSTVGNKILVVEYNGYVLNFNIVVTN